MDEFIGLYVKHEFKYTSINSILSLFNNAFPIRGLK